MRNFPMILFKSDPLDASHPKPESRVLHSAKNRDAAPSERKPGYAVDLARACQSKRRKIEQTLQDGIHDWLANDVYQTFLEFEKNRDEYQRFAKEPFFGDNYLKGRPKPDDEPEKMMRCVMRHAWDATEVKGGRYDTAMRYARKLFRFFKAGLIDPAEIRRKLKRRAADDFLFSDLAARPPEKAEAGVPLSSPPPRCSPDPSKSRTMSFAVPERDVALIRKQKAGTPLIFMAEVRAKGKLDILEVQFFD